MSKDFKEKYERVCAVKDRAISLVEAQLNGNIENVDAKELGEVADIAKDFAEIMEKCAKAEYYHTITEAMEESSKEDKEHYMNKYLPETQMYYTPVYNYARARDSRGRYMYTEPYMMDDRYDTSYRDRMYYSSMNGGSGSSNSGSGSNSSQSGSSSNYSGGRMNYTDTHDYRDGKAYMARRGYMEAKEMGEDKETMTKNTKKFMDNLNEDVLEMMEGATPEIKTIVKQSLAQLASKM